MELSIVMPCLNEAETLETCITKALHFLKDNSIIGEVIIADNGSTDGSLEIAQKNGARIVHVTEKGYGAAIHGGVKASHAKYCIIGDADDSYDFSALTPFIKALRENADLVMGNRFQGGIAPGAMPWKNRYIGNPSLSFLARILLKIPTVHDFHCGLRGVNRKSYDLLQLSTPGMEYATEMVAKASHLKMKIVEVPTTLSPDGRSRPPHLRPWRDGFRHLICIIRMSFL